MPTYHNYTITRFRNLSKHTYMDYTVETFRFSPLPNLQGFHPAACPPDHKQKTRTKHHLQSRQTRESARAPSACQQQQQQKHQQATARNK
ncbi:hypothetical protein NP493_317g01016 [Ridgeia piscesae]|uniref:Uncharacterized protein n=1 Tax=Ridgeia piscesae TaxID=27915 RepID=A0AAD9NUH7_RIDPI|nr:hypothetical protein NP493_317g01016 [Ridgeia piscesae]